MAYNQYSLELVGVGSQYASIADGSQTGLDFSNDFSIEAWIRTSSIGAGNCIAGKWTSTGNQRAYVLEFDATTIYLYTSSDGTAVSTTSKAYAITNARWTHVAVTYDMSAGETTFYINGVSLGTGSGGATSLHNSTYDFVVGMHSAGSSPFAGMIRELRLWSDIRTAQEISDNYLKEVSTSAANLVSYYKFNNDYVDATATGNDLTGAGTPTFAENVPFNGPLGGDWSTSSALNTNSDLVIGSSDLTNFPALILDTGTGNTIPGAIYSNAQGAGQDIRFSTDSGGEIEIPCEIVSIDTGAQTAEIHLKIPTLSYNSSTTIYIWSGNAGVVAYDNNGPLGKNAVWSNYGAIYHLDSTPDSTVQGSDLTNSGTTFTTAKIRNGASFDGSASRLTRNNPTGLDALTGVVVEALFKLDALNTTSSSQDVIANYGTRAGLAEIAFFLCTVGDGTNAKLRGRIGYTDGGGTSQIIDGGTNLAINTWYFAALIYDGSNVRLLLDGVADATAIALSGKTLNTPGTSHDSISVGMMGITSESDYGDFTDGLIDEVRFRTSGVSVDWIATEYEMFSDPTLFWFAGQSYARSIGDSLGLTDSLSSTRVINASITETMGLTDALSSGATYGRALAESLGLTDQLVRGTNSRISSVSQFADIVETRPSMYTVTSATSSNQSAKTSRPSMAMIGEK